ncbi:MAG: hypothetical protein CVU84_05950 [Firmicutes bacterium HGW-Firmicutes-1]|jgi:DNA mismatch repair ATPase MutS|nr:MAG: hypothetical protein CVU84_05950 [Firmicutes bacterium HGW-Firmicutes-1]
MENQIFSLLWLSKERRSYHLDEKTIEDLNISEMIQLDSSKGQALFHYLKEVPINIEDINYRQGILEEFADNRPLLAAIKSFVNKCHNIYRRVCFTKDKEPTLYNLLYLIDSVSQVMDLIEDIHATLMNMKVKSMGLIHYKEELEKGVYHHLYKSFKSDVRNMKALTSDIASLKIGINLDDNLRPEAAMLLSFHEKSLKLTRTIRRANYRFNYDPNAITSMPKELILPHTASKNNPLSNIEKLLEPAVYQLITFCDQFIEGLLAMHAGLNEEFEFYDLGIEMYDVLKQNGYYLCQPLMFEQGKTIIDSAYNINLAYKMIGDKNSTVSDMIYNSFTANQDGNIYILTGANRGGKTTFTQAIGQIFWLAQLGLFVPAKKAALRILDGIFMHFPSHEESTCHHGRFGNDCKCFSEIYKKLTPNSLLLMNESFSATSHLESLTVAFEAVKALKEVGVTTIFNTHLHELGRMIIDLNYVGENKTKCVSLVTGTEEVHQSFAVYEGEPLGQSYAQDIAISYGLTFEQLIRDDRLRKVVLAATKG